MTPVSRTSLDQFVCYVTLCCWSRLLEQTVILCRIGRNKLGSGSSQQESQSAGFLNGFPVKVVLGYLLCLYVADPATILASNTFLYLIFL